MSLDAPSSDDITVPAGTRVAIIAARFNAKLVDELLTGCRRRLAEAEVAGDRIEIFRVPGAFELPVAARAAAVSGRFAAVVCLGAVVRGDTPHFDFVAGEAAHGIATVSLQTGVPVIFGVLTTNTDQQAWDRAGGGHGHAGEQAAEAALEMVNVMARIKG